MANYPYEYFCGANVVVEIEGMPATEVAGLTYNIRESRMPFYGYSSRHWNTVGRGQVLVSGSLVINYIHNDYLIKAIETGREFKQELNALRNVVPSNIADTNFEYTAAQVFDLVKDEQNPGGLMAQIINAPQENGPLIDAMRAKYWTNVPATSTPEGTKTLNAHDLNSPVQIKITFGQRDPFNSFGGRTAKLLSGVYFLGKGVPIQIDEEVIVEEYNFIARNEHTINPANLTISADFVENEQTGEINFEMGTGQGLDTIFDKPERFTDLRDLTYYERIAAIKSKIK